MKFFILCFVFFVILIAVVSSQREKVVEVRHHHVYEKNTPEQKQPPPSLPEAKRSDEGRLRNVLPESFSRREENNAPIKNLLMRESMRKVPVPAGALKFVGSSDVPFLPPVTSPWTRIGLLVECGKKEKHGEIMNLMRRPIAPAQELWEYLAQDKDGFEIKLGRRDFLENGDIVEHVDGKGGPWCVANYDENRWVWV